MNHAMTIDRCPTDPRGYRLATEVTLPVDRSELFDFFADASNLEALTPPWLHFRILTPGPIAMGAGTLIDYRLRIHGVPLSWRTRIAVWEPPVRFVDEQLRGPYRYWRHEHSFEAVTGGTLMRDVVEYSPRGGALAQWLVVRRDLQRVFGYRGQAMQQRFGAAAE